jgi:hypothetical protein
MPAADTVRNFTDGAVTITDDGGNSHTCPLLIGTVSWSGLKPNGREQEVYETRGALSGVRQGARAYPTVTVEAQVHRLDNHFYTQAMGDIGAFVSTVAGIGDTPTNDLQINESYSTDTRLSTWDDCVLDEWSYKAGSPGQVSMTFKCLGPVVIDGVTYVPSR